MASRLSAGDEVALSGRVVLVSCGEAVGHGLPDRWPTETAEGGVCCFVDACHDGNDGAAWHVARVDQPLVDRTIRALLAAGTRGLIADGQCLATASYALRKYGGVFFAVRPDWLAGIGASLPPVTSGTAPSLRVVAVLNVVAAALTVVQDTHGHSLAEQDQEQQRRVLGGKVSTG